MKGYTHKAREMPGLGEHQAQHDIEAGIHIYEPIVGTVGVRCSNERKQRSLEHTCQYIYMITMFQDPLPFMHFLEPPHLLVCQLFWVCLDHIHIVLVTFLGVLLATHVLPLLEVIRLVRKVTNHAEVSLWPFLLLLAGQLKLTWVPLCTL